MAHWRIGYEHLYNKGVCHRDISISNILITMQRDVAGCLIDVDHAKQDKTPLENIGDWFKSNRLQEEAKEHSRYVCVGSLDEPEALPPKGEFFCRSRAEWMPEVPGEWSLGLSSSFASHD